MVEEEIKKMIEEDGKEREGEGVQSRKKREPMVGDWQGVQYQCESLSLFIPNVLGPSLASVSLLSASVPPGSPPLCPQSLL